MIDYSLIVAASDKLEIGKDNKIPWHISEDLKLFKRITSGNIVIMGRKTYESIGKPLPGRITIVITSKPEDFLKRKNTNGSEADHKQSTNFDSLHACGSLTDALNKAESIIKDTDKKVFIAGGASIYSQSIDSASKLYISRIPGSFEADTFFPDFNNGKWELESTEQFKDFKLEIFSKK